MVISGKTLTRGALGLLLGLVAVGCEAEPTPDLLTVKLFASPSAADPFTDVTHLVFRVKADDLTEDLVTVSEYAAGAPGEAPLPTIPYSSDGSARQLVVEGWTSTATGELSQVESIGRSQAFVVEATDEPRTIHVQMARINSFTPLTEVFTRTSQSLTTGRVGHTVTQTTNGETVIAGGGIPDADGAPWWTRDGLSGFLSTAELVDADTQAVSTHAVELVPGSNPAVVCTPELCPAGGTLQSGLNFPRAWHSATPLPTGPVFFAGGWGESNGTRSALAYVEWYEPGGPISVLAEPLAKARAGHTAILVDPNPQRFTILFIGGDTDGQGTYELWSPVNGSSGPIALPDGATRRFHASILAPVIDDAGQAVETVITFGGESDTGPLDSGLFFVVANEQMMVHPSSLPKGARTHLTATYVEAQNYVYFIGGHTTTDHTASSSAIDVYDTVSPNWQQPFLPVADFNLVTPRGGHTVSQVGEKMMVIMGGSGGSGALDRVEIIHEYLEMNQETNTVEPKIDLVYSCLEPGCTSPVPAMIDARNGHRAVVMDRGSVLVAGGVDDTSGATVDPVEALDLYIPQ